MATPTSSSTTGWWTTSATSSSRIPSECDVLLAPIMYGDILSDVAAGLVGGLGMAPGANVGDAAAVFEAVHGSAPRHAGQDRANPFALMLSGVMLLRHVGEEDAADRLEGAIAAVIAGGPDADLRPEAGARRPDRSVHLGGDEPRSSSQLS